MTEKNEKRVWKCSFEVEVFDQEETGFDDQKVEAIIETALNAAKAHILGSFVIQRHVGTLDVQNLDLKLTYPKSSKKRR